MKKSLTIYTESDEQLSKLKALMLSLEIAFKENSISDNENDEEKL